MITSHIKRSNSGYHRDEQLTNEHKQKELNRVTFQQNKSCIMISEKHQIFIFEQIKTFKSQLLL